MAELRTSRLLLRQWRDEDLDPFAALNADPDVMRYFHAPLDRAASDNFARRVRAHIEEKGWGLWAVEVVNGPPFIGFVGLSVPRFEALFTPTVEIGWRLAQSAWGHGYATEAALAAVTFGFDELGLDEILSWTTVANTPSRRVMKRLGMTHDPGEDFDHPLVPEGSPIRPHVLYRLPRPS